MDKKDSFKHFFLKQGALRGAISAMVGNIIFICVEAIAFVARDRKFSVLTELSTIDVLLMALVAGWILSAFPGIYGGRWLARLLYQDALAGSLTKKRAVVKGTLVGMLAGLLVCFVALFAYTRGDFNILIFRIISAIAIAGWMGGWAGAELAEVITVFTSQQQSFQEDTE